MKKETAKYTKEDKLSPDQFETRSNALDSRNILSHIYNEATAKQAETWIKNDFAPMLTQCVITLRERAKKNE